MSDRDDYRREVAAEYTPLLRSGKEPRWARLRERLEEEGISPADVAIGDFFPDDVKLEFCVIASRDGQAFRFDFDYLRYPDGSDVPGRSDAWIRNWEPIEDTGTYAAAIRIARAFLANEAA